MLNRRNFLKAAGLSATGIFVLPVINIIDKKLSAYSSDVKPKQQTKKWAMVIDIEACSKKPGCKDCITACNIIHNIPEISNPKDKIKWIWHAPYASVFPERINIANRDDAINLPITVMCNHCDNPPCVNVCPVKATWKREDGIIMIDYHRCIGCRYCMAACPYGARSFNWKDPRRAIRELSPTYPTRTKGVVEKCNFCDERLQKGLKPACVDACKNKGLFFGNLLDPKSDVRKAMEGRMVLQRRSALGTKPKVYYVV